MLTLAGLNFFSVATMVPLLCASFRALLPLIVVSRVVAPGPLALLPIFVTDSQSSDMAVVVAGERCERMGNVVVIEDGWQ